MESPQGRYQPIPFYWMPSTHHPHAQLVVIQTDDTELSNNYRGQIVPLIAQTVYIATPLLYFPILFCNPVIVCSVETQSGYGHVLLGQRRKLDSTFDTETEQLTEHIWELINCHAYMHLVF